ALEKELGNNLLEDLGSFGELILNKDDFGEMMSRIVLRKTSTSDMQSLDQVKLLAPGRLQ
ncbi:MAG: hypothetical protein ACUVQ8_08550, partial [Nitrososphaeria archaeon]